MNGYQKLGDTMARALIRTRKKRYLGITSIKKSFLKPGENAPASFLTYL